MKACGLWSLAFPICLADLRSDSTQYTTSLGELAVGDSQGMGQTTNWARQPQVLPGSVQHVDPTGPCKGRRCISASAFLNHVFTAAVDRPCFVHLWKVAINVLDTGNTVRNQLPRSAQLAQLALEFEGLSPLALLLCTTKNSKEFQKYLCRCKPESVLRNTLQHRASRAKPSCQHILIPLLVPADQAILQNEATRQQTHKLKGIGNLENHKTHPKKKWIKLSSNLYFDSINSSRHLLHPFASLRLRRICGCSEVPLSMLRYESMKFPDLRSCPQYWIFIV